MHKKERLPRGVKRFKNISPAGPKYNDSSRLNSVCLIAISSSFSSIRSCVKIAFSFAKSVFKTSIWRVSLSNLPFHLSIFLFNRFTWISCFCWYCRFNYMFY